MTRPLLLAATLAALALVPAAQIPRFEPPSQFAFQTHVFRRLLFDLKLQPLDDFPQLTREPADSLLILLGDTRYLNRAALPGGLLAFVKEGGAVLVATDRLPSDEAQRELEEAAGVSVRGETFVDPEADEVYAGQPFCPILVPAWVELDLFHSPKLDPTARLQVATNAPSCLERRGPDLPDSVKPLAWLPRSAHKEDESLGRPPWVLPRPIRGVLSGPLFAVGGPIDNGRILVLADHSIFINEMMLPTDNGNVEFAYNCLSWLRGEGDTKRHKVLFVEDGTVRKDLDVPLKAGPLLPPGATRAVVAAVDKALAGLEDQGALDRGLWQRLRDPGLALRIAVVGGTLLLLLYVGFRITARGRYRVDLGVPLLARQVELHTPAATVLEQRGREALGAGNLWEAARGLAREWFAELPARAGKGAPHVEAGGGWWRRRSLERRVGRLWVLAHQAEPSRVSPRGLRRVLRDLDDLRAALRDGTVKIV
jgi:hypothetical protein